MTIPLSSDAREGGRGAIRLALERRAYGAFEAACGVVSRLGKS